MNVIIILVGLKPNIYIAFLSQKTNNLMAVERIAHPTADSTKRPRLFVQEPLGGTVRIRPIVLV